MSSNNKKIRIKYPSNVEPEIILSKALRSIKSQSDYPLRDGYLRQLQNESLRVFDRVVEAMNKEILEVIKEK